MASHGPHPSILEHGLADRCERCEEIARDPFIALDDDNMRALVERTEAWMRDKLSPRSATEGIAMLDVERTLTRARHLKRLGAI